MDRQDSRQTAMDTRHNDGIAWRNTVRAEDLEWRQTTRTEDKEWRQTQREEDKDWRQVTREEDMAWRRQLRKEDNDRHARFERATKRCCALAAAAQSSEPGTSLKDIFALAKKYEEWLDGKGE
jgi:hypothetical protein